MRAIGKIGVLVPEIVDSLDYELLHGIHKQAKELGYDVLVFTDTYNPMGDQSNDSYTNGLENIYQLAMTGKLDGILFAAGRFNNARVRSCIYAELKKLSVPCLVLEQKNLDFESVFVPQKESMRRLTEHLIRQHGCRKLYCITGREGDAASEERLEGFCLAMQDAGMTVDENMVFYGNFWTEQPRQLGKDIAAGKLPKPDGIVCASDFMAIALCEALMEHGISVPEDIAVTGYDGNWASILNIPRITTVAGREYELGVSAVCRLAQCITGTACDPPKGLQHIRIGKSCGCRQCSEGDEQLNAFSSEHYVKNMMYYHFEQKSNLNADYITRLTDVDTADQLMREIDKLTYWVRGAEWLEVCLCEDWRFDFENPEFYREKGFSEKMLMALSKRLGVTMDAGYFFLTEDILPALHESHEPQLIVLTSLHHKNQIFGYISATYCNVQDIFVDAHYVSWCDAIAEGLNVLQKKQYQDYIRRQLEVLSVLDPATGLYNKRGLMEHLPSLPVLSDKKKQSFMCMLISYVQKNGITAQCGSDPDLMIATALRLSSNEDELICRLDDKVFAVILPDSGGDTEQIAQERMIRLEEKIRYMQGSMLQLHMPELVTDCSPLRFEKLSTVGSFIEEKQQSIVQKTEAVALMTGSYKERLYRLRREIHASPQSSWNVSEISEQLNISSSHFQRMYKAVFGITCKDDVIAARLAKAKKLLQNTDLRVQEIAYACGYSDSGHFMKQFKEKIGVSALQYRKQKTE